jgi:hypothetical protein
MSIRKRLQRHPDNVIAPLRVKGVQGLSHFDRWRPMHSYRVTFWGKDGCREGTQQLMADTDKDAFDAGSKMLSQSERGKLEVWRDTHLLARMNRDGTSTHGVEVLRLALRVRNSN